MRIQYMYHSIMRQLNRRKGKWQTAAFEHHHKKAKHYKGLLLMVLFI